MRDKLQKRLESLKTEFESGQKMLADLESKEANLRESLLRISGAIQVLDETLSDSKTDAADDEQVAAEEKGNKGP